MTVIDKCRKCRVRIPKESDSCPFCGGTSLAYVVDYWPKGRLGGRKRVTLPAGTTREEAVGLEESIHQRRKGHDEKPDLMKIVADLFPDYLDWYKMHRAASTHKDLSQVWETALKPSLGEFPILDIGNEHVTLYHKARIGAVKNSTINKELYYFSGFLKWCRREKKIHAAKLDYAKLPAPRPLPIILTPEEVARIIKAAEGEPFYRAFFLCLYALGFRVNEVRQLTIEDFDFTNRAVKVIQKGGGQKVLPLSDQVIVAVKDLAALWPMQPGEYLFTIKRTGKPIESVRSAIMRICARAGVTKKVTAHLSATRSLHTSCLAT